MKNIISLLIISLFQLYGISSLYAQNTSEKQIYKRSSLYSILVSHHKEKFGEEIETVFFQIPIPDKFNDHDLAVKVITVPDNKVNESIITSFIERNEIAKHIVGRWFNRCPETGVCNMELVASRGLYNASYLDVERAKVSQRGIGTLADAGESLIDNTFVIVNDITYHDRNMDARITAAVLKVLLSPFGSFGQIAGEAVEAVMSEIKGFGVTVTSYLYQLEWNDNLAETFYRQYYIGENEQDEAKRKAFNASKDFKLKYIGKQSVTSGQTSMQGLSTFDPYAMIRKVCTRAIDASIVALQRNYDEFKVKTPIFSVSPNITAKIGLKEGVSEDSRFEVLEESLDKNGKASYRRIGIIQPIKGKIWDNRYMAFEEGAVGAKLEATTFRKISGDDFYPGMLIREIKNQ